MLHRQSDGTEQIVVGKGMGGEHKPQGNEHHIEKRLEGEGDEHHDPHGQKEENGRAERPDEGGQPQQGQLAPCEAGEVLLSAAPQQTHREEGRQEETRQEESQRPTVAEGLEDHGEGGVDRLCPSIGQPQQGDDHGIGQQINQSAPEPYLAVLAQEIEGSLYALVHGPLLEDLYVRLDGHRGGA